MGDAAILLEWRNDQITRAASHSTEMVKEEGHVAWLRKTLENPERQLFVAECDGQPVGTVRADHSDLSTELSWTVAPNLRGLGIGSRMVGQVAAQMRGVIRAEVKAENKASAKIALHAGMSFDKEEQGVLHFSRPAI